MSRSVGRRRGLAALAAILAPVAALAESSLSDRLMQVDRATAWTLAGAVRVGFATHHPQGMVRIGDDYFVSSVEITRPTTRYAQPRDGHDRDAGSGVGHLFRIGPDGALLADLVLGEGAIYHPGGIDFDGRYIWVPVSEYRPDSRAIVYRVDPRSMTARAVLRVADHIGAVAFDRRTRQLHGVSWGARRFYRWRLDGPGRQAPPRIIANRSSYIDYQDCHSVGGGRMLCSGLATYRTAPDAAPFSLGGWEIVDLRDDRPIWQAPIALWAPSGRPMTQNPFFVEATAKGLRAYFMPDDDHSTIFAYDAALP